jgi:hypothetical protein
MHFNFIDVLLFCNINQHVLATRMSTLSSICEQVTNYSSDVSESLHSIKKIIAAKNTLLYDTVINGWV